MRLFDFVVDSYKDISCYAHNLAWLYFIACIALIFEIIILSVLFILWTTPGDELLRLMIILLIPIVSPPFIFYFKIKKEMQ